VELSPLLDRHVEMRRLGAHWRAVQDGGSRLVFLLGRRQVGKTFLLTHFLNRLKGPHRALFFTALPSLRGRQQLASVVTAVRDQLEHPFVPERFENWAAAFDWLATAASADEPYVVVLDEAPYIVDSEPSFPGTLQQFWDKVRREARGPRLMLVLTGSAVATMAGLLSASGALYGRVDDEFLVHPFDLPTAASVLSQSEPSTVIEAYAACGGYPFHLRSWDQTTTTAENLQRLAFSPGGLLLRNGLQLVADLPHEGAPRQTLNAIGAGAHRLRDIRNAIDQRPDRALDTLERATLVEHRRPLGAPDRSPGLWRVADPFLQGWYELCWADRGQIEAGLGEAVAHARRGRWQRHVGTVFEEQARQHAVRLAQQGALPTGTRYGEWWTTSGGQQQIDVLGLVGKRTIVIGEAKWDARPLDRHSLDELKAKERAAPDPLGQPHLVVWSRGGAAAALHAAGVRSFTPADMVRPG
jgi:hypothetical protein